MRRFYSEYAIMGLELLCGVLFFTIFFSIINSQSINDTISYNNDEVGVLPDNKITSVKVEDFIVSNATIECGEEFNYLDYIEAHNTSGDDIKTFVSVLNDIDTTEVGEKMVKYVLRYNGQNIYKTGYYYVLESEGNL